MPNRRYTAFGLDDFAPEQISPTGRKSLPDYPDYRYGGSDELMGFGPYGPQLHTQNHKPRLQLRPLKFLPVPQNAGRTPLLGKGGMQTQTGRVKSSTTPMTFPSPHSPDSTLVGAAPNANINGLLTVGGTRSRPKYDSRTYPYEGNRESHLMRNQFKASINQVPLIDRQAAEWLGIPQEKNIQIHDENQANPPTVDPYNREKRERVGGINQYEKRRAYMMLRPNEYSGVAQTQLAPAEHYIEPLEDAMVRHDKVTGMAGADRDEGIPKLVEDLSSKHYGIRQLAAQKIKSQGSRAIDQLREAARSKDVEKRLAAERILLDIEEGTAGPLMDRARASSFFGVNESSRSPQEMDAMRRQFMDSQYRLRRGN